MSTASRLTPQIAVAVPPELQQAAVAAAERDWPGCGLSGAVRLALARLAEWPDQAAHVHQGRPRKPSITAPD